MRTLIRGLLAGVLTLTGLLLASCVTTQQPELLTTTKRVVVTVPDSMWKCPLTKLPHVTGLTDKDVARLLAQFYHDNRTCSASMRAIQKYLEDAARQID